MISKQYFPLYHRFRWYATLENKTPAETFPKFPAILRVNDMSDRNPPITATSVTFWPSLRHASAAVIGGFRSNMSITQKKILKKANLCAVNIFDDTDEFYQERKCLEARSKRLKKQGNENKSNAVRKISAVGFEELSDQALALRRNENITWFLFRWMKGENLALVENLSEYKINKLQHGRCFVQYLHTRCFCIRKLVRKYHTRSLFIR